MKQETITQITAEWIQMTHQALDLKRIPSLEIRDLFKKTYEVLYAYHKEEIIPKELSKMLLEMDAFLYFAALITDKEFDDNPYLYQAVHSLAEALKLGFFEGRYETEYPLLQALDAKENPCVINLENGYVEDLI